MSEGPRSGSCPRCGAGTEPGQEYCLECGLRLPAGGLASSVGSAWHRRLGRRPPPWLWPVLLGLLVAAAMTGVAIGLSQTAAQPQDTFEDVTMPEPLPTDTEAPPPDQTEEDEPTGPTETGEPATDTETQPPPQPQLVDWPPSQEGYTIVIASIPTNEGRATAVRKAREVLGADLPEVGVLDSGEFSSLHPGYYVVFSGIYANQRSALDAVPRVQRLYPAAYVRQITR